MVSERQMNTALDYIATADSQGNRRLLGGKQVRRETGGFYVEPTIFDGLEPDHTLAREEVFGPVLGVQTFTTQDEAIRLANDTVYGLAAGLWTSDINRALSSARH
jgi:gamma-glutamyl-gamma-aminobutyraldehyde dehydrogenase